MTSSFQQQHSAMLLKYSGISFISGAVNHGFFSGARSLWTAAIGIVLFVLGAWLEHRQADNTQASANSLLQTLVLGSLLSIGLGFFTGGLQHFPDSPARSAWVVPLGFFVSVLALAFTAPRTWHRAAAVYALVLGCALSAGSWSAWQWLSRHPEWAATGHAHGESTASADHHSAVTDNGTEPKALVVSRSMAVQMDDQMRFTPDHIAVQAGETIRFVLHNAGRTPHEMVLGSEAALAQHAQAMRQGTGHQAEHPHGTGTAITVDAGQTGELVVRFAQTTTLQMACLIPGHYEAGMRGKVTVGKGAAPEASTAASSHDHAAHKH